MCVFYIHVHWSHSQAWDTHTQAHNIKAAGAYFIFCALFHFWWSRLTFLINCSPLLASPLFFSLCAQYVMWEEQQRWLLNCSDLVDGHFTLIVNVLMSLSRSVPTSFRVNTLHLVTADVNISVDLMALRVCFACVSVAVFTQLNALSRFQVLLWEKFELV